MLINNIEIFNFRNISHCIFEPGKKLNIIHGNNANGKTSLIESIYCASNLKSFRTSKLNELINVDSRQFKIICSFNNNSCSEDLFFQFDKSSKIFKKNNKKVSLEEYLFSIFSIVFVPDDISFINGSPGKRRELIDRGIFYTDKNYINTLKKFYKILANKNVNLRNNNLNEIYSWNSLIAKYSSKITYVRNTYIKRINELLRDSSFNDSFKFSIDDGLDCHLDDLEQYYLDNLDKHLENEIKYKYSLVGAHRQNIDFFIKDKSLKVFGSQGQKRSFILALRASQITDFKNINNFLPILLLDDMASELDIFNKNNFMKILENYAGQTFITTTDKNSFKSLDNIKYFCINNGNIKSIS